MKTLSKLLLTVLFSLYSVILFATSYTWNGTTSTAWGTGTNWTPNGVPGSGDNVTIVTTSNQPVYDGVAGVTNLTMTSGTLNLGGYQLNITGTATFNGGAINNGRVNATGGTSTFNGTTFGAVVWVNSGALTFYNSVFNDSLLAVKTGSGNSTSNGRNKYNSYAKLENSGTGQFLMALMYPDTFMTTTVFTNSANGSMYVTYNGGYGSANNNVYNGEVEFNNTGSTGTMSVGNNKCYFNDNVKVNCTSSGGITFGTGICYLSSGKTIAIGSAGWTAGTLTLNKIIQSGTAKHSFIFSGSTSGISIIGSKFNGVVNVTAPKLGFTTSTFGDSLLFLQNGSGGIYSSGGSKCSGYAKMENSGSGQFLMALIYPDTFITKAVFTNSANGSMYVTYNGGYGSANNNVYNGEVEFNNTGSTGTMSVGNNKCYFNDNVKVNCTSSGGITFGTGICYLAFGKTIAIGSTGFTSGTLTLNKIIQTGTAKHSFSFSGSSGISIIGSKFNGVVNIAGPKVAFTTSTFGDSLLLTQNGIGGIYSHGGSKCSGYAKMENSGSGQFLMALIYPDTFITKAVFTNSANGSMYVTYNGGYGSANNNVYNGEVEFNNTGSSGVMSVGNNKCYFNDNVKVNCTSSGGITFGIGPNYLASGKKITVGSTGFTAGTLTLNKIYQQGTDKHVFNMSSGATLTISNSTIKGVFEAIGPKLSFSYNLFEDSLHILQNGAGGVYSYGKNKFNAYTKIENSGTGNLLMSFIYPDTFMTKAVFNNTANGQMYVTYDGGYGSATNNVYNGEVEFNNTGSSGVMTVGNVKCYFNDNIVINCTSTSGITFGNGLHYLASGKTISIGSTGLTAGTLTLNKIIQSGNASVNLIATGSGGISSGNCIWGGNFTASAPNIYNTGNNKFSGKVHLTKTSNTANTWSGGNKFSDSLTLVNSGTSYITMANGVGADTLLGNVKLNNTSSGSIYAAERYSNLFYGNITASQNVYFANNDGTVLLKGSADQTFSRSDAGTTPTDFKKLTIDKTSADDLFTLNKPINVSSVLTLTKGRIATNSTNYANLLDNATVTGASNDSYVDGVVRKTGNDAFTFPVGTPSGSPEGGGQYRPISISAPASTTDAFTAQYFLQNSNETYSHSAKDGSIAELSRNEYWNLARTTGTSNVSVTLSIDSATSCNVDNLSNLKVAAWDGSTWKDKGNGGTSGNVYVGTVVTSAASSTFGAYTIGTSTSLDCTPGAACLDAMDIYSNTDSCLTFNSITGNSKWYYFTALDSMQFVQFTNEETEPISFIKIKVYKDSCSGEKIKDFTLNSDESISVFMFDSLEQGHLYYVNLAAVSGFNSDFSVCSKILISNLSICSYHVTDVSNDFLGCCTDVEINNCALGPYCVDNVFMFEANFNDLDYELYSNACIEWTFSGGSVISGTLIGDDYWVQEDNPVLMFSTPGTYYAYATLHFLGCSDPLIASVIQPIAIEIIAAPEVDFTISPTEPYCLSEILSFELINIAGYPIDEGYWDFDDGGEHVPLDLESVDQEYNFNEAGIYTVLLHTENQCGAGEDVTHLLTVQDATVELAFSPSQPCTDDEIQFSGEIICFEGEITSWLWDFDDGNTSSLQNPTHQYSLGNIYTVMLTVNGLYTANIEVTVGDLPDVNISSGILTTCKTPASFSVPYVSTTTYSWNIPTVSPSISFTGQGTNEITVTDWGGAYETGATITITATTNYGCDAIGEIEISGCCMIEDVPNVEDQTFPFTGTTGVTVLPDGITISNQTFTVNGTWNIVGNLIIDNCNLYMAEDAKIIVNTPYTLTITSSDSEPTTNYSWLRACSDMWDGIIVNNGAEIIVDNYSLIEDAKMAVYLDDGSNFTIDNAVFNKNYIHVYYDHRPNSPDPSGTITNSRFLCQTNASLGTVPAYTFLIGDEYVDDYITFAGIYVDGQNGIAAIGAIGERNFFENANFGIYAPRSSIRSLNNSFKNIISDEHCNGNFQGGICGSGIYASNQNYLYVEEGNTFKDCRIGVFGKGQKLNVNIENNDFTNATLSGITSGIQVHGSINRPYKQIKINDNEITGVTVGIRTLNNPGALIEIGEDATNTVTLEPHIFWSMEFGTGIMVEEAQALNATRVKVNENEVNNAVNGIWLRNMLANTEVIHNDVDLAATEQNFTNGILGQHIQQTNIGNNLVTGTGTDWWRSGIRPDVGSWNFLWCNTTRDIGRGLFLSGPLTPCFLFNNEMDNNGAGMFLNYSLLNNIGTATTGWDETWPNHPTGAAHTYAYETQANQYTINFHNAGTDYVPTINQSGFTYNLQFFNTFSVSNSIGITCPTANGTGMMGVNDQKSMVLDALNDTVTQPVYNDEGKWIRQMGLYTGLLENDSVRESDTVIEAFYDSCFSSNIGKLMRANDAFRGAKVVGETWVATISPEIGELYLDTLYGITTSIVPEDALRDVLKIALEKYLDTTLVVDSVSYKVTSLLQELFPDSTFEADEVNNPFYTSSQLSALASIAEQCPYEFGPGVYMARAMLSQNDTIPYLYYNICEASPDSGSGKWDGIIEPEQNNIAETDELFNIFVYPNPTKEELFVSITGAVDATIQFEMWNTLGQKVKQIRLNSGNNAINTSELLAGIYHYTVFVDGSRKYAGKEVIIK